MARRWQLAVWVFAGLVLLVVALWDDAGDTTRAATGDSQRIEASGDDGTPVSGGAPGDLAFRGLGNEEAPGDTANNRLRPTTTTRPTTTAPSSSTATVTSAAEGDGSPEDGSSSSTTSIQVGTSSNPATLVPTTTLSTPPTTAADMTTVYYQDFAAGSLDRAGWEFYNSAGHAGWGLRRPSALSVVADGQATGGHSLMITAQMGTGSEAGQLVSGGMKLLGHSQTYGRYRVRVRVEADPDQATSGVVLLWPANNDWPTGGEINIFETWGNRATRAPVESNLHWAENGQDTFLGVVHHSGGPAVSGTQWHTYTLDWHRDYLAVSVDDGPPNVLSTDPGRIPQGSMDLTVQLDGFDSPGRPGQQPVVTSPVRMFVDWIQIERFEP